MKKFICLKLNVLLKDRPKIWKVPDLDNTGCLSWFRDKNPVQGYQWHLSQAFIAKDEHTFGEWGSLLNKITTQGFPYCRDWGMHTPLLPKRLFVSTCTQKCCFCKFYAVVGHFPLNISLSWPLMGKPTT